MEAILHWFMTTPFSYNFRQEMPSALNSKIDLRDTSIKREAFIAIVDYKKGYNQ